MSFESRGENGATQSGRKPRILSFLAFRLWVALEDEVNSLRFGGACSPKTPAMLPHRFGAVIVAFGRK